MQKLSSTEIYNILSMVRNASGLNRKKDILSVYKDTNLPKVLCTMYSPFVHFNITCSSKLIESTFGNEEFTPLTNVLLNRLSRGLVSGNKAKKELKDEIARLNFPSASLLSWIISKNARIGLGATSINEVFPNCIPVHEVQLAKPLDEKKLKFPCIISPKLDGLRASFDVSEGVFRSRLGNIFKGLTKLEQQAKSMCEVMHVTKLDGELMVIGEHFNEISGQIRSFNETDKAIFHVFDFPLSNRTQYDKIIWLDRITFYHYEIKGYENIVGVPHKAVDTREEMFNENAKHMEDGYEGSIIKAMNETYKNGRSNNWMKIKTTETLDLVVTDIFRGTGKYATCAGGLIVDFKGKAVRVGSGLTDNQRNYWWQDPDEIIGKVVEVAFQETTPDGSLRHPRLITVRGDK